MADLTPIEEYNKKLRESSRELEKQTGSLRTPFKQLIGEIKNVNAEFASPIGNRTTSEKAESAVFSSLADAICVSGVITGKAVNIQDLKETKDKIKNTPVFANTGVNINNIEEIFKIADGCVIGSSLKFEGIKASGKF